MFNQESTEDFTYSTSKKGYGHLGKVVLDFSIMKKKVAESKTRCKKLNPHRPVWLIAVGERLLEFYSD